MTRHREPDWETQNPPSREWYEERLTEVFGVDLATAGAMYNFVDELTDARPTLSDFADYADDLIAEFVEEEEPDYGEFDDYWLDEGDELEESASAYGDGEQ